MKEFKIVFPYNNGINLWKQIVNEISPELRDIHFLPEYALIYKETYGQEPFLVFFGDEESYVFQIFVKRKLNDLPFLKEQGITQSFFDISNPYGYGGPIINSKNNKNSGLQLFKEFTSNLISYFENEGYASEFTSLHPILKNHTIFEEAGLQINSEKKIIYIDLNLSDIKKQFNRGTYSNINKAIKSGILIKQVQGSVENLAVFNDLYYQTMRRQNAAIRWFFPENYFANCFKFLGNERTSLFFACKDDYVVSAFLLIHDFKIAYYHFGASNEEFFELRPNNLLMCQTAEEMKKRNYSTYHLGGGVTSSDDDPLYKYKCGFSKNYFPLFSYFRIHNKKNYEYLCECKRKFEINTTGEELSSVYFPLYRR